MCEFLSECQTLIALLKLCNPYKFFCVFARWVFVKLKQEVVQQIKAYATKGCRDGTIRNILPTGLQSNSV